MALDDLPLHVVLTELADVYETVASLPPVVERARAGLSGTPGSRVPPGMSEVMDADEHARAVTGVDDWAEFVAHVLIDEHPGIGSVPDSTPGRLRLASRWADELDAHADVMLRYALQYEVREHLVTMRRLAGRGSRRVRTQSACLDVTCPGTYTAVVDGPEATGDLVCSGCGGRVAQHVWERWSARSEWVTVAHAARMLGISEQAVRQRASRGGWRRRGEGRHAMYATDDVEGRVEGSAA